MMDETQKAIRVLGPCGCSQAKLCHPTAVGTHSAVTSPWRGPQVPPVWPYKDDRNSPQRGLSRGVERLAASRLLGMVFELSVLLGEPKSPNHLACQVQT